jgi:hypothetical protein
VYTVVDVPLKLNFLGTINENSNFTYSQADEK